MIAEKSDIHLWRESVKFSEYWLKQSLITHNPSYCLYCVVYACNCKIFAAHGLKTRHSSSSTGVLWYAVIIGVFWSWDKWISYLFTFGAQTSKNICHCDNLEFLVTVLKNERIVILKSSQYFVYVWICDVNIRIGTNIHIYNVHARQVSE